MAHLRPRHLEALIRKALGFSPIVGILGHRQVGKTTLLEAVSKRYETLDLKSVRKEIQEDVDAFVSNKDRHYPRGIDECQLAPELFPALKEQVRKNKRPGQFLLSGSIRFTSRKAIQESLTGRIVNLELLPFTLSELESEPLPDFGPAAIENTDLSAIHRRLDLRAKRLDTRLRLMRTYFVQGGLPGICFVRDPKLRDLRIDSQLETLLDRDLRLIQKTTLPVSTVRGLCAALARTQGEPLDLTHLQEETGISTPTIKKLLYALEGIFLIRTLRVEGGRKGIAVYFEDQAEAHRLGGSSHDELQRMTHFALLQLRAQFAYRLGASTEIFQYRTRGGAVLPLCFRNEHGVLGVLPIRSEEDAIRAMGSVNSFLKSYSNAKVFIVHPERKSALPQARVLVAPLGALV